MVKSILVFIAVLLAWRAQAQSDHFMMIRADNDQPFYVRMGEKILSSSSGGHLIISRLKDSVYSFTIGFPRREFPDEDFSVPVRRDMGFLLKKVDEKVWVLFNTQSMEMLRPQSLARTDTGSVVTGVRKDDAFSRMMAGVVNDTAVMYNTYASDSVKKASDSVQRIPSMTVHDTVGHNIQDSAGQVAMETVTKPPVLMQTPYVELLAEHRTAAAIDLSFADHDKGHIDTIQVIIPKDTIYHKPPAPIFLPAPKTTTSHEPDSGRRVTATDTTRIMPKPDSLSPAQTKTKEDHPKLVVVNSDCRNFATDADVIRLKAKMQTIPKDEDRILFAKKTFHLKCFTTNQIRTLSELFTNDASKFSFMEAAYPFVSDDQFRSLSDLMSDPFYIGKFRKMTGQ